MEKMTSSYSQLLLSSSKKLERYPNDRRGTSDFEAQLSVFETELLETFDAGGKAVFSKKKNVENESFIEDQVKNPFVIKFDTKVKVDSAVFEITVKVYFIYVKNR